MHIQDLTAYKHNHDYSTKNNQGERHTLYVLILTATTTIVEIIAGTIFGSMALLADGWHMATHVAAFFITIYAYRYSKKNAMNPAFTFGTGKVGVLGGFASAIALAVVALVMLGESVHRIFDPQVIRFNAAISVAFAGLLINLICAFLLKEDSHHHHVHDGEKEHHHHDHNLKAAYFHVLADALTSVLAMVALFAGKYFTWYWLDPVMGIVGAIIITKWAFGLLKQTSPILLDGSINEEQQIKIKEAIESDADNRVTDIHIWKISENHYAIIISLVTHFPKPNDYYKKLLNKFHNLSHMTIEVHQCESESCIEFERNLS